MKKTLIDFKHTLKELFMGYTLQFPEKNDYFEEDDYLKEENYKIYCSDDDGTIILRLAEKISGFQSLEIKDYFHNSSRYIDIKYRDEIHIERQDGCITAELFNRGIMIRQSSETNGNLVIEIKRDCSLMIDCPGGCMRVSPKQILEWRNDHKKLIQIKDFIKRRK